MSKEEFYTITIINSSDNRFYDTYVQSYRQRNELMSSYYRQNDQFEQIYSTPRYENAGIFLLEEAEAIKERLERNGKKIKIKRAIPYLLMSYHR